MFDAVVLRESQVEADVNKPWTPRSIRDDPHAG
jgi:hypothetical protein